MIHRDEVEGRDTGSNIGCLLVLIGTALVWGLFFTVAYLAQ